VERSLRYGSSDFWWIDLRAGDYIGLGIDQRGIDVMVILWDPAGRPVVEIDTPTGTNGPEPLRAVARHSGCHRVEIRPLEAGGAGRYVLRIEALRRPATAQDRSRAAAVLEFTAAERRWNTGDAASLRTALAEYRGALRGWRSAGERREEGLTLWRIGQISVRLGELRAAADSFERSLEAARELGDMAWEVRLLNELGGTVYRLLGELERAEDATESALALALARGDLPAAASAWNNLGLIYEIRFEPQRSLDAYNRALEIWKTLGERSREAATLNNLGIVYAALGRTSEAADLLRQALFLRRSVGDRRGEAASLSAIAWVEDLAGDPERALALYDTSIPLSRQVGDERGAAVTLGRRGAALARRGRTSEALASYRQALKVFEHSGERLSEAQLRLSLGGLHRARGDTEAAAEELERALPLFREVRDPNGEAWTLLEIARMERDRGHLEVAAAKVGEALRIVESLRAGPQGLSLRSTFLATRHDFYELAIDLLMRLHERSPGRGFDARALEVSERARARTLLDSMAEMRSRHPSAAAVRLGGERRRVQDSINATEGLRMHLEGEGASPVRLAAVRRDLRTLLREHETLRARLRQAAAAERRDPEPSGIEEIRARVLDGETLLLEYSLGEKRSFLWLLGRDRLESRVLPGRAELEERARQCHELLRRSPRRSIQQQAELASEALGATLLGPVAAELDRQRLLIVPDGALLYVPFAALPVMAASGGVAPLLQDHEIIHLPSASMLALLRRERAGRRRPPGLIAVLADPVFGRNDPRLGRGTSLASSKQGSAANGPRDLERSAQAAGLDGFPRLPASRREAELILRSAPRRGNLRAFGFDASRERVLAGALAPFQIVHFATHGLIHPEHPELSGIVLSLLDAAGRPRDGFLRLHEIYDLDLQADLVVLSACRTALGQEVRGEGLIGLTQGFFHAGASRVVVSLWGVDDEATAELMGHFYRGLLRQGLPPGKALRAAQLALRDDPRHSSPYFWAGFTLQGEWR
jgi:CHAT domain-containing protein/predicted negative regulator of RcsB-dependent stress response